MFVSDLFAFVCVIVFSYFDSHIQVSISAIEISVPSNLIVFILWFAFSSIENHKNDNKIIDQKLTL